MTTPKTPDATELLVLDALIAAAHAAASQIHKPTLRAAVTVLTCLRDRKYTTAVNVLRETAAAMGDPL